MVSHGSCSPSWAFHLLFLVHLLLQHVQKILFCGPGSVSTVVLCKKLVAAEFSGAVSAVTTPYFSVKFFCELNEHVCETSSFLSELAVKFYNCLGFQSSSCSLEPPRTQWRLCCSSWSCQWPAAPPRRPRPRTESPPSSQGSVNAWPLAIPLV